MSQWVEVLIRFSAMQDPMQVRVPIRQQFLLDMNMAYNRNEDGIPVYCQSKRDAGAREGYELIASRIQ